MKLRGIGIIESAVLSWAIFEVLVLAGAFTGQRWLGYAALPFLLAAFLVLATGTFVRNRRRKRL